MLSSAVTSYLYLNQSDLAFAAQPSENDYNLRGNKENKVRFFGTPQQIYQQFATELDEDGKKAMSYEDFFKALTPYNYQKPKDNSDYFDKFQAQVNEIMKIADVDGDGQISFAEFYFFVLLCQTPEKCIIKDFNKAGGKMTLGKLAKTIGGHKAKTNFTQKFKAIGEKCDFTEVNIGMCQRIFKGKNEITYKEYMDFRNKLVESLWHFEFHQFEKDEHDHITAFDIAQSLYVYYIPFHKIPDYLLHLDKYKDHKMGVCDAKQYCAFQYFLRNRGRIVQAVLDKGRIDFDGLRELADEFEEKSDYCREHGCKISDEMLHAFLNAMDLDGNGVLDVDETVGILTTRKEIGSKSIRDRKSVV